MSTPPKAAAAPAAPPPIGSRIAERRAAKSLSLQELSTKSGVSKGMISQIENGQVNPTLAVVWKLANGLEMKLQDLLDEGESSVGPSFDYLTKENCPTISSPLHGYEVQILSTIDMTEKVEVYLLRLHPNGVMESAPHSAGTMEILTVVQGEMEVEVEGVRHPLRAHESARYAAGVRHTLRCVGKDEALANLVVKFPAVEGA